MHVETSPTNDADVGRWTGATQRRFRRLSLPSLRLRTSERRMLLVTTDVLLINAALVLAWRWGDGQPIALDQVLQTFKWYITLTVVWLAWGAFFGVYDLARAASTVNSVRNTSLAVMVTVLTYLLIPNLTPPLGARGVIFVFLLLALALVVGWRIAYARLFVQPWFKQQALVIGAGWAGQTLAQALRLAPHDANPYRGTGYQILGFVDDRKDLAGARVEGIPVLGGHEVLVDMAMALQVDEIILAITHRHAVDAGLFDALLRCREQGLRITTMPTIYERLLGRVPVQHVGRELGEVLPMQDSASERLYWAGKRIIDVIFALLGLAALALVAPAVALANAVSSPGPLFYRQVRVGYRGRTFQVVKFRSMVPNAEQHSGAVWASAADSRITAVGRLLRKTRLDELPQVINVLRGEMSVIGPRPERPEFVDDLAQSIPFYRARHAVRPGITGWAQVQYGYGSSVDDSRIKLEYDLYYVKNISLLLDIRILMQTAAVIVQFRGT